MQPRHTGGPTRQAGGLDPITLEIQWQRLVTIADEMDTATIRTSFSSIVGESHDFGCVLMDEDAAGLAQAQWSPPQFCTMMPITTRHMLHKFPKDTLRPGDVLLTNDPWIGSTHLPDYNLISPVFHRERLVAFLGTVAHVSDVGGHLGDLEATDVFQEGTRVLPTFFFRAGEPVEVIHDFIAANSRAPEMVMGDLNAIVGTHRVGIRRIQEFLDDYELPDLRGLSAAILDRSESALREAIAALPDGVSTYEVTADGYREPFTLRMRIEIRGSDMTCDFAGSSPQQQGAAINAAFNITYATAVIPIKCMLVPRIPNNDGLVRPLRVTAPEGSIVNCTFPAPVKARAKVMKHIPPVIFGALAPLLPERVIAAAGGIFPFHVTGEDRRFGKFVVHVLPHGGLGATAEADGWPPAAYPHNSTITPTEIMELQCPVLMLRKAMLADTGGAGRRRGGPGQEFVLKSVADRPMTLTIRPDCGIPRARGVRGAGRRGGRSVDERGPRRSVSTARVSARGRLRDPGARRRRVRVPGEREREWVRRDVADGYVTAEAARTIYGLERAPQ